MSVRSHDEKPGSNPKNSSHSKSYSVAVLQREKVTDGARRRWPDNMRASSLSWYEQQCG